MQLGLNINWANCNSPNGVFSLSQDSSILPNFTPSETKLVHPSWARDPLKFTFQALHVLLINWRWTEPLSSSFSTSLFRPHRCSLKFTYFHHHFLNTSSITFRWSLHIVLTIFAQTIFISPDTNTYEINGLYSVYDTNA